MIFWNDASKTVLVAKCRATPEIVVLAQESLAVQDACNGIGVAQGLAEAMASLLCNPENTAGTDWASQHPITHVWVAKLTDLTAQTLSSSQVVSAFELVLELAAGRDVTFEIRPPDLKRWRQRGNDVPVGPGG